MVKKDRRLLPQTIMYFKNNMASLKDLKRVVRVYKPTKFSLEFQVCSAVDGINKLHDFQQLTRGMKRKQIKEYNKIYSGDKIQYKIEKELEQGLIRGDILNHEES